MYIDALTLDYEQLKYIRLSAQCRFKITLNDAKQSLQHGYNHCTFSVDRYQ